MKEQSHKSEMRAALRGDFERLHARRRETGEPVSQPPVLEEPVAAPDLAPPEPERLSWLDRLRDRR